MPFLQGSSQGILARWFDEGLQAFSETCPTGRAVYEGCADDLIEMLADGKDKDLEQLIEDSGKLNRELKQQLEHGRDRLLEMHSNGGEEAQKIVDQIAATDGDTNLVSFALSLFDTIGFEPG